MLANKLASLFADKEARKPRSKEALLRAGLFAC